MNLAIEPSTKPNMMRVVSTFDVVVSRVQGIAHLVTIPAGYEFDGASIPRFVWSWIGPPFDPSFVVAACVHDWYCDRARECRDYQLRVIGDAVFFALLERAGVASWRRAAMYVAVRAHAFVNRGRIYQK